MLPLNMVIPAVKSDMASVLCGTATEERVRTVAWMSCVGQYLVAWLGDGRYRIYV